MGYVDSFLVKHVDGRLTETIVAHPGYKLHVPSQACGSNSLIGSFASVIGHEAISKNGLSWLGKVVGSDYHISVGTTHYNNVFVFIIHSN